MTQTAEAVFEYPTVGAIASHLHVKTHQVCHIVRRYGLTPVGKAGAAAVYSLEDVSFIASILKRIARERGEVGDET